MKTLFATLAFVALTQFASAVTFGPGKLYSYDEASDSWNHEKDGCTVEIKNVRTNVDVFKQDNVYYDLLLRGFGRKVGNKAKMSVSYSTLYMDLQIPEMIMSRDDGEAQLELKRVSWEDLLQANVVGNSMIVSKGTFTNGHFGGKRYKWRYKCEF